ncbi:MAG: PEP-CTERM sorting domain-containing protein [Phycisphaeraceae bacterium]
MTRLQPLLAPLALISLLAPSTTDAAITFSQTFTNRTNSAASGLRWWFAPDATVSNTGSNVFANSAITHHPNPIHGQASAVDIWYASGNVNVGNSAKVWAKVGGSSSTAYRAEWTNNLGTPIGSAYLPCSFGGSTLVQGAQHIWSIPIDNPNDAVQMTIRNLEYSLTTIQLSGPQLQTFSGTWNVITPITVVDPGQTYTFDILAAPDELPVIRADLSYDSIDDATSSIIFQPVPEPATLATLALGWLCISKRSHT